MASTIELEKLDKAELVTLKDNVEAQLKIVDARRAAEAKAKAEAIAKEYGFSLSELTSGGKKSTAKTTPGQIKYVDPGDPTNTWTGRGRQPAWFVEALDAGYTKEQMEVV